MHYPTDGQQVRVTILGEEQGTTSARIVRASPYRAEIAAVRRITAGTPVRVDADDAMLLGEVSRCRRDDAQFILSVELDQVIPSMSDLGRLVSAVMTECEPRAEHHNPVSVRAYRA
jgi:hypothetical protein